MKKKGQILHFKGQNFSQIEFPHASFVGTHSSFKTEHGVYAKIKIQKHEIVLGNVAVFFSESEIFRPLFCFHFGNGS